MQLNRKTTLVYRGILKNILDIVSMEAIFNKEQCIETLKLISCAEGLDKIHTMVHSIITWKD